MYSACAAWGCFKKLSNRKSSREVGGRGREVRGPDHPQGVLPQNWDETELNHSVTYGRSNLVVKVKDSWPACHEFETSTAKDPPCWGGVHAKSVEVQTSTRWCGVEVRRGGMPALVSPSSLDYGSKLRGLSLKALK
ncbi:hypothetical protein TNCV_3461491 [Trichonephila clavipes]|nr:hypothetical protein TNCV_3461491 [Trichonephila clavipes]